MSARTIHPFPARMAPEIALDAIPQKKRGALTILDPMCGSGTVLSAALERGHNAIGIDIDPLAVMMSRLAVIKIDSRAMLSFAAEVAETASASPGSAPWGDDDETGQFVDYWFGLEQRRPLTSLATAMGAVADEGIRLALQLALSRIIVTKSPQASLAADTSHSRPHRVITWSDYDVLDGFRRSCKELAGMLDKRQINGTGIATLGDSRDLSEISPGSVDLAVTSPPYLNALDYLRGHKLALVWFGHRISDLRARRSSSIGAERGPSSDCSDVVVSIVDVIESSVANAEVLKRPMLERFAEDCVAFATQLQKTVKPGGTVVLVVGNSTLRGNYIKNDLMAQMAMEHVGFTPKGRREREIPPSRRYMAINAADSDSSIAKRMRSEVVLTMVR